MINDNVDTAITTRRHYDYHCCLHTMMYVLSLLLANNDVVTISNENHTNDMQGDDIDDAELLM